MSKRVIVFGGRGFIGSSLVPKLKKEGYTVHTVDRKEGGVSHYQCDITNFQRVNEIIEEDDKVVNLIGLTPVKKPSTSYFKVHVRGAKNIIQASVKNNAEKLVHISALGATPKADTEYLRTKGDGEVLVDHSSLNTTILKPSVVFDKESELIQLMDKLMWTRFFPNVKALMQPVYREDITSLLTKAVEGEIKENILEVAGPEKISLYEMAKKYYKINNTKCLPLPSPIVKLGMILNPSMGKEQRKYLNKDNTTSSNKPQKYINMLSYSEWIKTLK